MISNIYIYIVQLKWLKTIGTTDNLERRLEPYNIYILFVFNDKSYYLYFLVHILMT